MPVQSTLHFMNICLFSILKHVYPTLITFIALSLPTRTAETVSLKARKNISSHYNTFNKHKLKQLQSR